jgi:hypothetical protein
MKTVARALIKCNHTNKYLSRDRGFVIEEDMTLSGCLVRLIVQDDVLYIRNNYHGLYLDHDGAWEALELTGACRFKPFSLENDLGSVRFEPLDHAGAFVFSKEDEGIGLENFAVTVNTDPEQDVILSSPYRAMSNDELNGLLEVYTKGGKTFEDFIKKENAVGASQGELFVDVLGKNWSETDNSVWTEATLASGLRKSYIKINPGTAVEATVSITQQQKLSRADAEYIKDNFNDLQEKFGKEYNKMPFVIKYTSRQTTTLQTVLVLGGSLTAQDILARIMTKVVGWIVNKLTTTLLRRALTGETANALERYAARSAGGIVNLRNWSLGRGAGRLITRNCFRFIRFLGVNIAAAIAVYYIFKLIFKQQYLTGNFFNISKENLTLITPHFDNVANQSAELGDKLEEGLELPGMATSDYVDGDEVILDKPIVFFLQLTLENNFELAGLGYLLEIHYGSPDRIAYTTTSIPYSADNRINIDFTAMGSRSAKEVYDKLKNNYAKRAYEARAEEFGLVTRIDKLSGGENHSYTANTYFVTRKMYDDLTAKKLNG